MKKLHLASAIALLCTPIFANAADITGAPAGAARLNQVVKAGYGANYKARIEIDKQTIKNEDAFVIKTGDIISTTGIDKFSSGEFSGQPTGESIAVGPNKSMGWNDTAVKPYGTTVPFCSETVTTGCYLTDILATTALGWGHNAHWYLIDLNKLAGQKVHVHIMVERYDDGVATETSTDAKTGVVTTLPSDDDLVPALTVWLGNQDQGTHMHWFPNRFQSTPDFWARKLSKPSIKVSKKLTYELKGVNSGAVGYDTAFDSSDKTTAMVEGVIALSKTNPNQNFLTVALGGDDRIPTKKHDVNYKLTVEVHKPHK